MVNNQPKKNTHGIVQGEHEKQTKRAHLKFTAIPKLEPLLSKHFCLLSFFIFNFMSFLILYNYYFCFTFLLCNRAELHGERYPPFPCRYSYWLMCDLTKRCVHVFVGSIIVFMSCKFIRMYVSM